jgi:hypothetical protein
MPDWTPEKALSLAPDDQVARAARGLAVRPKWPLLMRSDRALWGECRGSGKRPYRVRIDLSGPAFKCSCPSRKHPCKHSLCLLLIFAGEPDAFRAGEPPGWVAEWLGQRDDRETKKQANAAAGPRDPAAAQKRVEARERKVRAGLDELRAWLEDLVGQGLAAARARPASSWHGMAARLVDAQAPGLARLVRQLGSVAAASREGWAGRLLTGLGRLHLAVEGYGRLERLPEPTREDLRAVVGWTFPKEDLLAREPVSDRWLVLGCREEVEERLLVRRTWLLGRATGRRALLLDFAHLSQEPPESPPVGLELEADVVFHPSAVPLRALLARIRKEESSRGAPPTGGDLASELRTYREAVARQPWLETWPVLLAGVEPVPPAEEGDPWVLRDPAGPEVPMHPSCRHGWSLLGFSGGRPVALFGEWDGEHLRPLTAIGPDGPLVLAEAGDVVYLEAR